LYVCSPEVASCEYTVHNPSNSEMHLRIELMAGVSGAVTPADILKKGVSDIISIFEGVKDAETVQMDTQRPSSPLGMRSTSADLPPEVLAVTILFSIPSLCSFIDN